MGFLIRNKFILAKKDDFGGFFLNKKYKFQKKINAIYL